jgi:replicative DNA helicase
MVTQHHLDDEAFVITSVLLEPWRLPDIAGQLTPEMLQSRYHADLWAAMLKAGGEVLEADVIAAMAKQGTLKRWGEDYVQAWVVRATNGFAHIGEPDYVLDAIVPCVRQRGLRKITADAIERMHSAAKAGTTMDDLIHLMGVTLDAVHHHAAPEGAKSATEALNDYMTAVEAGGDPRISTGYERLDSHGAFMPGGLYTLAARSGEGKSTLVANIAARMQAAGTPFGVVTVEMTELQMVNSIVGVKAGIDRKRLLSNRLTDQEKQARDDVVSSLQGGWQINDRDGQTVEQVVAQARSWVRRHGVRVVIIDHLQRIRATDASIPRHLQVGHITWALKGLARSENIVVLLAVQINREGAREGAPKLHHLKESGSVEEDSDGVIAIYVDRAKNSLDSLTWDAQLWWIKNRHGSIGTSDIRFERASGRMLEVDNRVALSREVFDDPRGGK